MARPKRKIETEGRATPATPAKIPRKAIKKDQSEADTSTSPRIRRSSNNAASNGVTDSKEKKASHAKKPTSNTSKKRANPRSTKQSSATKEKVPRGRRKSENEPIDRESSSISAVEIHSKHKGNKISEKEGEDESDPHESSYWLMKAEPESRIEKGKDVKFSIDDLKNATEPEAWDGVRNAAARNNMRQMMKGDLAFFYHSNCKVPGIVGTMEIVREHSVDESAFDPSHPYFDEKSKREAPKWCVVHVEFRKKFPEIVKLKELQKFARPNGVLENMQVLKISRLSVSKVTKKEWDFIMSLQETDDVAAAAAHQPQMAA